MEPRSLNDLAAACGGELLGGSPPPLVTRVQTDSRLAGPGDLFVALKAERFDAHDFLPDVALRGVAASVVAAHRAIRSRSRARVSGAVTLGL